METKIKFSDCSAECMQNTFGLRQIWESPVIDAWNKLAATMEVESHENVLLNRLKTSIVKNGDTWNEIELIEYFIAPIFTLIDFNTELFKIFSERRISATIGEYELYGEPDAFIATGTYSPKIPYFCFNEYKRLEEHKGDVRGQLLAEMLVAQTENGNMLPVYGVYVVEEFWHFVILHGRDYCISKSFAADDEEIFDIFKILKALKVILIEIARQGA